MSSHPLSLPPQSEPGPRDRRTIAPWWHTALVLLLIAATSALGTVRATPHALGTHHLQRYLLTIAWEWVLAALVLWGIRLRGARLRDLIGGWPGNARACARDIGIAMLFWIVSTVVLAALAIPFRLAHLPDARRSLAQLAPESGIEFLIWVVLSLSAGFCEELLFRGYLQQQFERVSGKVWVGAAVSALCFGAAHGYERFTGVVLIAAFGAMFSMLVLKTRNLRSAMIAHAWHDIFTGAMLALIRFLHLS